MPTQIERLQAHADHLLDAFIQLREKYALLHPMHFDKEVVRYRASGRQRRGFLVLRSALFLSCSQDVAKLGFDRDDRTPSVANLLQVLTDQVVYRALREQFAVWKVRRRDGETDPEIIEALERMDLLKATERREQFDDLWFEATSLWTKLSTSKKARAFQTIRDKVTSHVEVKRVADKYQVVDIQKLGIKWADLRSTIEDMERLVEIVGLLIRNAGFAWDLLGEQLSRESDGFWKSNT